MRSTNLTWAPIQMISDSKHNINQGQYQVRHLPFCASSASRRGKPEQREKRKQNNSLLVELFMLSRRKHISSHFTISKNWPERNLVDISTAFQHFSISSISISIILTFISFVQFETHRNNNRSQKANNEFCCNHLPREETAINLQKKVSTGKRVFFLFVRAEDFFFVRAESCVHKRWM